MSEHDSGAPHEVVDYALGKIDEMQKANAALRAEMEQLRAAKAEAEQVAKHVRPLREWSEGEKVAYIQEHGIDRYREILNGRGR